MLIADFGGGTSAYSLVRLTANRNAGRRLPDQIVGNGGGIARDSFDSKLVRNLVGPKDVDAIFMTGGSSFVPAVRRIFEQNLSGVPIRAGQEFTSVAEGLALCALDLAE